MEPQPDYIVDIEGVDPTPLSGTSSAAHHRSWLAILWKCCHTYSRIYRNPKGDAYVGNCPRCAKSIRVGIGPDGTSSRFFSAE